MASDFHTHIFHPGKRELLNDGREQGALWSCSFHPWYTKVLPEIPSEDIERCTALGEMGFDKCRCETVSQEEQLKIVTALLRTASDFRKPVVLHWVGAYDKLFQIRESFKDLDFLFHGYARSSTGLLAELLGKGFYVSLSPRVAGNPAMREFLKSNPGCKVGLESDDCEDLEIEKLYDIINIPGFEHAADDHFGAFLHL